MTATVTALIELGVDHGFGVAILIIGAQLLLDRLLPVEFLVGHLLGAMRSEHPRSQHPRGAHRLERDSGLARCME